MAYYRNRGQTTPKGEKSKTERRMQKMILWNVANEVYSAEYVRDTLTVGELIDLLQQYDENEKIVLSFNRGYTYGDVHENDVEVV
jgi:hypothetical protein